MATGVQEHVGQSVPDFPRRAENASVKSLGEYPTSVTGCPVERPSEAGADGHHAARERARVGDFDEEVSVCGLQGVVDEPEVTAIARCREAALQGTDEGHRAQGG